MEEVSRVVYAGTMSGGWQVGWKEGCVVGLVMGSWDKGQAQAALTALSSGYDFVVEGWEGG